MLQLEAAACDKAAHRIKKTSVELDRTAWHLEEHLKATKRVEPLCSKGGPSPKKGTAVNVIQNNRAPVEWRSPALLEHRLLVSIPLGPTQFRLMWVPSPSGGILRWCFDIPGASLPELVLGLSKACREVTSALLRKGGS